MKITKHPVQLGHPVTLFFSDRIQFEHDDGLSSRWWIVTNMDATRYFRRFYLMNNLSADLQYMIAIASHQSTGISSSGKLLPPFNSRHFQFVHRKTHTVMRWYEYSNELFCNDSKLPRLVVRQKFAFPTLALQNPLRRDKAWTYKMSIRRIKAW